MSCGCKAGTEAGQAEDTSGRNTISSSIDNHNPESVREEGRKVAKSPRKKRYRSLSTEATFLLLKIENEADQSRTEIVIDNNDWLPLASKVGFPDQPVKAYAEYMLEHDSDFIKVPADVYQKLLTKAVPEGDPKLAGMSDEEVLSEYFNEDGYVKDNSLRVNKPFLRSLLERDFLVQIDCESGLLTVKR